MDNRKELTAGILTVSDRAFAGKREDRSGADLIEMLASKGWDIVHSNVVPDEQSEIARQLEAWADSGKVGLILTTGGTGFAERDVTPEATLEVIDRLAPGLTEPVPPPDPDHMHQLKLMRLD